MTLLYLPGIVFVGMEHTLHLALVLAAVLAAEQRWAHPGDTRRAAAGRWAPYVLVGLAMLTRGETAGVVGGLAVALVVVGSGRWADPDHPPASWAERRRAVAGLGGVAAASVVAVAVPNLAFGQHALPNSVVLKALTDRGGGGDDRTVAASLDRLLSDPWLTMIVVLAAAVVVAARRARPGRPCSRPWSPWSRWWPTSRRARCPTTSVTRPTCTGSARWCCCGRSPPSHSGRWPRGGGPSARPSCWWWPRPASTR